jgi:hypothetical protein
LAVWHAFPGVTQASKRQTVPPVQHWLPHASAAEAQHAPLTQTPPSQSLSTVHPASDGPTNPPPSPPPCPLCPPCPAPPRPLPLLPEWAPVPIWTALLPQLATAPAITDKPKTQTPR